MYKLTNDLFYKYGNHEDKYYDYPYCGFCCGCKYSNNKLIIEFRKKRPNIKYCKSLIHNTQFYVLIISLGSYIHQIFTQNDERYGKRKPSLKKVELLVYIFNVNKIDIPEDLKEIHNSLLKPQKINILYKFGMPEQLIRVVKKYL